MAIISIKNKGKYGEMLAGNTAYDPGAYYFIERVTASGSQSTATFSSIPQTYKHLQIRGISRDSSGSGHYMTLRFNSDTGNNYVYHMLIGGGNGTVSSLAYTSQSRIVIGQQPQSGDFASNIFGAFVTDIHDYSSSSKNKTTRTFTGKNGGSSSYMDNSCLFSGLWLNTNAVTSITLTSDANWVSGTTFALYGIVG
jgi:hypothetical protein